ncbi:hypothetical protein PCANC_08491 [Puccinia coronata f. sp. avenae]|uniref:Uncharacterized protein n=1 Tax=Puccinia coronata f. sp. avenae TaxID=200324 RepID=A0A2N5T4A9_9BASI|nr:hypothetical protein PCANC_08491 [Puccinia coronata f. sp. avenae]
MLHDYINESINKFCKPLSKRTLGNYKQIAPDEYALSDRTVCEGPRVCQGSLPSLMVIEPGGWLTAHVYRQSARASASFKAAEPAWPPKPGGASLSLIIRFDYLSTGWALTTRLSLEADEAYPLDRRTELSLLKPPPIHVAAQKSRSYLRVSKPSSSYHVLFFIQVPKKTHSRTTFF